jgi:hypothetical protein
MTDEMKTFPVVDPAITAQMFVDIGNVVEKHLGFFPPSFVLILTDGKHAQTLFAGADQADMTRLLIEGADNHRRYRKRGSPH